MAACRGGRVTSDALQLDPAAKPLQPTWFGHPPGLTILFLTEMWEKFSYFGMRALLVYYMTKALAMRQEDASWVYGGYTSFAYFTPILGGLIADRYLGRRRAVILGGSIMAVGHFMMAIPAFFYPALATIAIGNGFFLPSLPSQVRHLYAPGDPRGDTAFSVYYVGINLGAVLAPLICGTLGELYGWHYGFAAAGVGMCLGLVIYIWGGRYLPREAGRVQAWEPAGKDGEHSFARRFGLLLGVIAIVVVFRGAYEQVGNTVALWADSAVDRSANLGWTIPSTWFQALNPLLVFTITPLLLLFWARRGRTAHTATPLRRMALGALIVAISYGLLAVVSAQSAASATQAHWLWLFAFFLVYTTGELFILPTGLALFGRLAPGALAATTMALWFSASFAGNLLAGGLGSFWTRLGATHFFMMIALVAAVAALLLRLVDGPARRTLGGMN
jgi:POT family proton-dependent oligopeptide transporter